MAGAGGLGENPVFAENGITLSLFNFSGDRMEINATPTPINSVEFFCALHYS